MSAKAPKVSYSFDNNFRLRTVLILTVALGAVLAVALERATPISPAIVAPAALGASVATFIAYYFFLWKVFPFSKLNGIPHLAGVWTGSISDWGGSEEVPAKLEVTQNWASISLLLTWGSRSSRATVVGMRIGDPLNLRVSWIYLLSQDTQRLAEGSGHDLGAVDVFLRGGLEGARMEGKWFGDGNDSGTISLKRSG